MKTIDRNACKQISADMLEALKAVALKHGVQFSYKSGNFSSSSATFRIEAAVVGDGGVAITAERRDYPLYCSMYGLRPEWLDKSFRHGTDTFTIIGLNTRKHKNPILGKSANNGKTYIFPADTVKALMIVQHPSTPVAA
jgi:hypothetical protein